MALDPEAMDAAVLRNLEAKTGRRLEAWLSVLQAAGPFAKPALAVDWLKAQGLGHVTAQVVVRQAGPAPRGPTVDGVLGAAGGALFREIETVLAREVPQLKVGVRQGYVTLATKVQFAVAGPAGSGIRLGLVAQAPGAALPPAPPMGGSDRFRLLLEVPNMEAISGAIVHLRAAAAQGFRS
jgi:hypothetical protein